MPSPKKVKKMEMMKRRKEETGWWRGRKML
jgi:hypothetical protein